MGEIFETNIYELRRTTCQMTKTPPKKKQLSQMYENKMKMKIMWKFPNKKLVRKWQAEIEFIWQG